MPEIVVETGEFYRRVLEKLNAAGTPFLIGGAFGLEFYTGVARHTKDVDVFVRPRDRDRVLGVLADAGYTTEITSPIWLAKARWGGDFADIIFSSGNAIAEVDDVWFEHAAGGKVLGVPARFCPPEEMIWSKAYIMERERYDGADVVHLVRARGHTMDWRRLLARFGPHWRVLLGHLVLFGFVYPSERQQVPAWVMDELAARLAADRDPVDGSEPVCQGTLLSRTQYRIATEQWGYRDGRLRPNGRMTPRQAASLDRED
jgi:hypothetical protein